MKYTAACLLAVVSLNDHVEAAMHMSRSPADMSSVPDMYAQLSHYGLHHGAPWAQIGETCNGWNSQTNTAFSPCEPNTCIECVEHGRPNTPLGQEYECVAVADVDCVPTHPCQDATGEGVFHWLCEAEHIQEAHYYAIEQWARVIQPSCDNFHLSDEIMFGLEAWEKALLAKLRKETAAVEKLARDVIAEDHPPLLDFSAFTDHSKDFLTTQRQALEAMDTDLESEHSDAVSSMNDYHDEGVNSRGEHVGFDVYQDALGMSSSESSTFDSYSTTSSDTDPEDVSVDECPITDGMENWSFKMEYNSATPYYYTANCDCCVYGTYTCYTEPHRTHTAEKCSDAYKYWCQKDNVHDPNSCSASSGDPLGGLLP